MVMLNAGTKDTMPKVIYVTLLFFHLRENAQRFVWQLYFLRLWEHATVVCRICRICLRSIFSPQWARAVEM